MRPLVIVRPEPGATATARAAGDLGLSTIVMPLFAVRPLDWERPDARHFDALLLTSANAVRNAGEGLERYRRLPAHCVGEATAAAARQAGLAVESVGPGTIDPLLASLPTRLRLLHLCGAHRREPAPPSQQITVVPVYEAVELPAGERVAELEGAVVAVHSPRAAERVARVVEDAGLDRGRIAIVAISPEAGRGAGGGWSAVEIAPEPSDRAILAIAARLCNNPR